MRHLLALFITLNALALASPNPWKAFQNVRCSQGVLPTPTYGQDGALFTACVEQLIHAPIMSIYNALIDFQRYYIWNQFVVRVDIPPGVRSPDGVYVGMEMNFTSQGVVPGINVTSSEVVTVLQPGRHFAINAWRANDVLNGTLLKAEHPNILTDVGGGWVRYVSYETYYVPSAVALLPLQQNLQNEFAIQGRDLKAYVEGME